MKKVNLLSRAEMKKVMGGVVPPDCGEGFVPYSCEIDTGGGWGSPSVSCVPTANGGSVQDATDWVMERYRTHSSLCDEGCAVSCG